MLGLLGLRILEACGAGISDEGEGHGHRVLEVHAKGDKTVLVPLPRSCVWPCPAIVGRGVGAGFWEAMGVPELFQPRRTACESS